MNIDLGSTDILLTGATRGIGLGVFEQLKASGANLISHSSRKKGDLDQNKFNHHIYADLAEEREVIRLFKEAVAILPNLNVLILNAGIFEPHSIDLFLDTWLSTWQRTIQVNLTSSGILTKLAIEHFRKIGGGRIIYISSRAAVRGETEEYLAYAASKGGLTSLAKSVARSFGKDNIKAFVIAPGFVRTAMAEQFINQYGEKKILNEISLKTLTEPKDLAPLVALISSGLLDHATGTTIDVNAGSHIR